jgi:hypothetical protein
MIPPTPTPLPPGMPHFVLPDSYGLWGSTSTAIQTWNWMGGMGDAIQLLALLMVVLAGLYVLWRFIQGFIRKDAES